MSNFVTTQTQQTLPEKLRKEHSPQTGDIYLYNGCQDKEIIRLGEKEVYTPSGTEHYVRFKTEFWSFAEGRWSSERRDVSESDLKEFYKLCLFPLKDILKDVDNLDSGMAEETPVTETEELVTLGTRLPDMLSQTEMLEDRMETLSLFYRARMDEQIRLMEEKMRPLKALVEQTQKQLLNIRRAISIVEIYDNVSERIPSLGGGKKAN